MMPLDRYMVDEIAIFRFNDYDNIDGKPSFTGPEIVLARVESNQSYIRNLDGQQIAVEHFICTQGVVNLRDKIAIGDYVSGGDGRKFSIPPTIRDAQTRSPVKVKYARLRVGDSGHTEFYL